VKQCAQPRAAPRCALKTGAGRPMDQGRPRTDPDMKRVLLFLVLVAATAAALLWNELGMERHLRLDARSAPAVGTVDDHSSGGRSSSALRREGDDLVMDCDIRPGYAWPYCTLVFELGRPPAGVDLSGYGTLTVEAALDGPEPARQLRLFLLNFNPAYSKPGQPESAKVHEFVYDPAARPTLRARLAQFTVSSWWSNEHPVDAEHAGPELGNVVAVQVATGGNVQPGHHVLRLRRIDIAGKVIAPATFRLGVIAAWGVLGLGHVLALVLRLRRDLAATRHGKAALESLNRQLEEDARHLTQVARRDALTGVLNRHGLRDELARAAERGDERFFPVSIVFVDIDHFKRINDTHGHAVGDQVIMRIADVITGAIQREDLCARWGGEEFLLIFPGTRVADARAIAERLRRALHRSDWPAGLRVTGSFGVAQAGAGEDLVEGIRRADEAMYAAKSQGRDRVELAAGAAGRPSLPPPMPAPAAHA
jgi:diguanylate cyclase (GGDEF)-like protein